MNRRVQVCLAAAFAVVFASQAAAQGRRFDPPPARTSQGPAGGALSLPSNASPRAILAQYLRGAGHEEGTARSIVEGARNAGGRGVTHQRFEQRAGGLPVYGTYAKASFNARGELVHVVENLARVPASVARARVNAQQAIAAAVAAVYPTFQTIPAGFFRSAPTATRVAIPHGDGTMSTGFVVETWAERTNQLHESLVDGDGTVLNIESRTSSDSYNVFRISPLVTPQAVAFGPGAGNAESPSGWLFAVAQNSTNIAGNNVRAYLDVVSNNKADNPGSAVTSGNFTAAANLALTPSTAQNREVAVQNLFFLNNYVHDVLYRHGFTEGALNFQENNFTNGGAGSDSVNAEAQDGGGTDNANFATPRDGQNPRMQMYLWNGLGTHEVLAGGQTYLAAGAEFGPALTVSGVTAPLRLVNDGAGTSATDACEPSPAGSLSGAIALIDRGNCEFALKVKNAQDAGALAAIVANNINGDSVQTMGAGTDRAVNRAIAIGSVFVSQNSGIALKAQTSGTTATVALSDPQPLHRDGDIDADIVFHEYCHGLTWRMIGSMSGVTAGAIGEGMSDLCAMLLTTYSEGGSVIAGADRIGEYSASDARGIRRDPYDGYPRTYKDVAGASVHDDGEIYAAIGWKMIEAFGPSRINDLFGYIVDGMNFTPAAPTYEQMRDGILQAIGAPPVSPSDDACLVWRAFAAHGVGVGATATVTRRGFSITESKAAPPACAVP
jgi:hypothetical protein